MEPSITAVLLGLAQAGATAAVNAAGGKCGEYVADKAIEAYEAGWDRDRQAGGISFWSAILLG
ncbi:hypothetical protein CAL7716_103030 (plasmid) [Calothrix sp. PCC 7716]|nr:hypothetical protein CAL7716_103030 [Calothrix sp. PCC 7716]